MASKRAAAVPDVELVQRIVAVVREANAPLPPTSIGSALGPGIKKAQLDAALRQLAAQGTLFKRAAGRKATYSPFHPDTQVRPALLQKLEAGPATASDLKKAVKQAAPGATAFPTVFAALQAEGVVFRHPPVGGRKTERFGLEPPDPGLYSARQIAELRKVEAELRDCGVTEARWKASLAQALGLAASAPGAPSGLPDRERVLEALRAVAARQPKGAMLSVAAVREQGGLPRARFDAALLALREARVVSLHHHDFPQGLPPEQREALVVDPSGVHYVGVVLEAP